VIGVLTYLFAWLKILLPKIVIGDCLIFERVILQQYISGLQFCQIYEKCLYFNMQFVFLVVSGRL